MALAMSRRLGSSAAARSLSAALLNSCSADAPSNSGAASCSGALADEWPAAGAAAGGRRRCTGAPAPSWQLQSFVSVPGVEQTPDSQEAAEHSLPHFRSQWRPVVSHGGNNSSSGSSSGSDGSIEPEMVKRRGKMVPVDPGLAAKLEPLAAQCAVADMAALARAVAALHAPRQQGVIDHGLAVAAYLRSLGIELQQMAQLLQRCPELFSRPPEKRPLLLFGQLTGQLGMTAAAAARCFETQQAAAGSPSFEPAIVVLAALLAAGSTAGKPASGEQLLGEHLAELEAALQQELGGDRQLWLKVLRRQPRGANCSVDTFREREFGRDAACEMRYAPGQLTAAQVIDSWASYVAGMSAQKLTARLLFLEQLGLLPRLVPTKGPARREWRRQRGLPANSRAAGEPAFISVRDLSVATPADFAGVVAAAATQQPCEPVSSSSIAAFQAGLPQLATWQQLWAQAEEMSQELRGQLPQQLLPAAEAPVASL
ncbi:hypothetical protein CHLNCDRAFT_141458 [Chlorella variabilis]|uniref:Uncharacterized protein n=1 Tax=Chlorella variabilis TaxID=554065 RepID=E1ZSX0_CHLVA|nr:hypothetical protein CHLNCDRAFT_141458 [Chlorella variabilis]EFN51081.1 hypothetical protein CHLNCDRAFT_141458 [Chlorella variabilis]|eukprot:XP_005843183.1 hypothetical protein CHLNCDRAFT_141458 [Chlorella variabilis]